MSLSYLPVHYILTFTHVHKGDTNLVYNCKWHRRVLIRVWVFFYNKILILVLYAFNFEVQQAQWKHWSPCLCCRKVRTCWTNRNHADEPRGKPGKSHDKDILLCRTVSLHAHKFSVQVSHRTWLYAWLDRLTSWMDWWVGGRMNWSDGRLIVSLLSFL